MGKIERPQLETRWNLPHSLEANSKSNSDFNQFSDLVGSRVSRRFQSANLLRIVLKSNICSARRFAGQIYLRPPRNRPIYIRLVHRFLTIRKSPVMDPYPLLTSRLISMLLLISSFFGVIAAPWNPRNPSLTMNTTSVQILQRDSPLDLFIKVGRRSPRALSNGTVIYGPVRSDKQEYSANEIWTITLGRNHVFKPRPYIVAASTTLIWKLETIEPSQQGIYLGFAQFKSEEQKIEAFNRYCAIEKEGIVGKLDSLNEIIKDLENLKIVVWGDVKWEGMYTKMKALLRIPLA
ncbi:hypothetical protein C8R41DRAFT_919768 [Lentinula lateritia]|uniref:Uncharacterized protein n=1 Tax=Lentinula lateritia TaxID=40482 RepID=A0ABQ8VFP7_9AGAR|nr:hypothetical protein C8R41DRAFT_919768 [Lentinula lateritia]